MKIHKKDEAVSPVIGVILMVAITVILAAIVGIYGFGLAGEQQSTSKTVMFTASQNSSGGLEVLVQGSPDLNKVSTVSISIEGVARGTVGTPQVGEIIYESGAGNITPISGKRVILTAEFEDGTSALVVDKIF